MNENDHSAAGLVTHAAFRSMTLFATKMLDLGWPSLPGLLGGMQIIEGRPSDPGVEDDWNEVIAALGNSDFPSSETSLSPQAAYDVTFRFLTLQFRRRSAEKVSDVVRRLGADASGEQARDVVEDWQDALAGS